MTMRWRRIRNEWNLKGAPWRGAVGIEEDDEQLAVPAVVCWFTRGWPNLEAMVDEVCRQHNSARGEQEPKEKADVKRG